MAGFTLKRQKWCKVPVGGPCVRNLRAGQYSVKVTSALLELPVKATFVRQVPSIAIATAPGMRHRIRVWRFGKNARAFPPNDDLTAAMTSRRGNGTGEEVRRAAAWWLLPQADASTSKRTSGATLKTLIGPEDTTQQAQTVIAGYGNLAWAGAR